MVKVKSSALNYIYSNVRVISSLYDHHNINTALNAQFNTNTTINPKKERHMTISLCHTVVKQSERNITKSHKL